MARRISWVLLGVAGVVIAALWLRNDRLQIELDELRSEVRAAYSVADAQSGQTSAAADSDSAESVPIENDLEDEWRGATAEVAESPPEPESKVIAATDENDGNDGNWLRGLNKDELRQVATNVAEAQYAELYQILALDEDTERIVRDIIAAGLANTLLSQSRLRTEADTIGERKRLEAEAAAEIDAELRSILTADELAAWREYEATFEQRQLETGFLVMMVRASTNLSGAGRDTVAVVLTQEWFAAQETFADELFNDVSNANMMIHATESALDRLYNLLDENEFALAEEFIQTFVDQLQSEMPENNQKSKSLA